jgi:RNA polymerase sigma-70 factor (ECF subfamily)
MKTLTDNFTNLVTQYSSTLKPFAISLTKDTEDANDLLQETVYRALSSQDKYSEGTNLKAWLFTIMKNIFINNYRRKVKRNTIIDSTENDYYLNSLSNSTVNTGETSMQMEEIRRGLEKLATEYRIPFMMHYHGFKYHEIAEHLTLPIGTVKSRIHFARKELKRMLARV